jgi:hypothetical protein
MRVTWNAGDNPLAIRWDACVNHHYRQSVFFGFYSLRLCVSARDNDFRGAGYETCGAFIRSIFSTDPGIGSFISLPE